MSDLVGLAVIGTGRMGSLHAENAASLPDARLVAVCDIDPAARALAGDRYGVPALADLAEVMRLDGVDAVVVVTTTRTHGEAIVAAARAGKHVFTEKPIGLTLEDTDGVLQEVVDAGITFQIGFQRRWDPAFAAARRAIEAGTIGEPRLLKAQGRDPQPATLEYHRLSNSGGLFLDAAIHDYDAARYLMGHEVVRVTARGATLVHLLLSSIGDIDSCVTVLEFEGGALGVTEWNRFAVYGYDVAAEVQGPEGAVRIGGLQQTALEVLTRAGVSHDTTPGFLERFRDAYRAELAGFVAAVKAGRPSTPGVEDARKALQLALCARESHEQGRGVEVPPLAPLGPRGRTPTR